MGLFTLCPPVEFSWKEVLNSRDGPDLGSARLAPRQRAPAPLWLLQLYHSAPISQRRVNKRQRSCRFPRLQAAKVRDNPSKANCRSSVSIFRVKMVKLSGDSRLHFASFSLDRVPAWGPWGRWRTGVWSRDQLPIPPPPPHIPSSSTNLPQAAYSLLITFLLLLFSPPNDLFSLLAPLQQLEQRKLRNNAKDIWRHFKAFCPTFRF